METPCAPFGSGYVEEAFVACKGQRSEQLIEGSLPPEEQAEVGPIFLT